MHLTDTSINHKQHKWSITISPSQLARLTIHWWKAHKSCTPLTSGTPFSFEDFTDSMKTVQALCPGRSLYAVPAPWLSPVQLCLLAALHSPEFAGKGLYVGAHVCMYVCGCTHKQETHEQAGTEFIRRREQNSVTKCRVQGENHFPTCALNLPSSLCFFPDIP